MSKEKRWRWKTTKIDFSKLPHGDNLTPKDMYSSNISMVEMMFMKLPLPHDDTEIYYWYNGGFSTQFNEALFYAIKIGLAEWVDSDDDSDND